MRGLRFLAAVVLAPLAVTCIPAPVVQAGVVLVSRTSTLTYYSDVGRTVQEQRSTDEFGRYNDRIESADGFAAQDTTFEIVLGELLGSGRIATFAGMDEEPGRPQPGFVSDFRVTFDVVGGPAPYTLTGEFFNSLPRVDSSRISLRSETDHTVFLVSNGGFPESTETNPTFDERGILEPGRYELSGSANSTSSDLREHAASADFAFAVIPLPPAVWAAVPGLVFAAAAARGAFARRRA